jgi:plasmid stability protein
MATITVRNIPEEVITMIKNRARRNKRSMEQEVRTILSEVVLDRERAMKRIESLWQQQKRPISKEEVDAWLRKAGQNENSL